MDNNMIIKGLVKEFEMQGTIEFLTHFNAVTRRVENMSMYIGKYQNFTFMCNGQALLGYMKRENENAIHFTFKDMNKLPWTNEYNPALKAYIKKVVDMHFKTNQRFMFRLALIMEGAKHYEEIAIRALKAKVIRKFQLSKETQILIANKLNTEEVACDVQYTIPEPKEDKTQKEEIKITPMQLAHKIRKEEKLEGHYYAQMSYALKKAYLILKQTETTIEYVSEELDEVAADISTSRKEELTVQEVLEKYKDQYDAYVYFDGFNIHLNIKGRQQVLPTKYKGLRLEREFISKLGIFNQLNKTLIIHHYDVFEPVDKIDFIRIPC